MCKHGLQLVESRLSKTNRNISYHTGHNTSHRVVSFFAINNKTGHLVGLFENRTANRSRLVNLLSGNSRQQLHKLWILNRTVNLAFSNTRNKCNNLNIVNLFQKLLSNGPRSNTANRLSGRRSSSSRRSLHSVFRKIGEIRMRWSWENIHLSVIFWSLILVLHNHRNRSTQSLAKLRSRLNLNSVLFVSWSSQLGLARTSSRQLRLDVLLSKTHVWWYSVHNTSNRAAVRLTVGGHFENGSK
ncbi:hypothetical protein OGAPHI_006624 [Ogataea philodendri]|uniref:Uncharacterized protein n=1 Tax=Ogataea philodendri TaxID=1378263 RepID=A0A9P8NX65_9ASCO|nr:uncharacterized protein OGAPHI_006624 [Ogataea philodendri]KAH3661217.1 hypothetical protein OGAPHI_006624 [Ogataea philodendri]